MINKIVRLVLVIALSGGIAATVAAPAEAAPRCVAKRCHQPVAPWTPYPSV
jgi:hypothetical protein